MDPPGEIANLTRGQLNKQMIISLSPFTPDGLVSRDGFGRPIPRQSAHSPHSVRLNLVLTHEVRPDFRVGVHFLLPPTAMES